MKRVPSRLLHCILLACALLPLGCASDGDDPSLEIRVDPRIEYAPQPAADAGQEQTEPPDCAEGYAFEPARESCVRLDACEDDNAGCGDPSHTRCLTDADGSVLCEDIDECEHANPCGGYACFDRVGAPPLCDTECPAGSLNWAGDHSLCIAAVKSFFATQGHGCALLHDGRVRCVRGTATPFPEHERFVSIDTRAGETCGVRSDRSATCLGQAASLPLAALGTSPTKVLPGFGFACGLEYSTLRCVGSLPEGALSLPKSPLQDIVDVDVYGTRGCAVRRLQGMHCWGTDPSGELAAFNAQEGERYAGVSLGPTHGCALHSKGWLHCWQHSSSEPLPDARIAGPNEDPRQDFIQVSVGTRHTCALRRDGSATCWGTEVMDEVSGPSQWTGEAIKRLTATDSASCAFLASGRFQCWGAGVTYGFAHIVPAMAPRATSYAQRDCLRQEDGRLRCEGEGAGPQVRVHPLATELFADDGQTLAVAGEAEFFYPTRECTLRSDGRMHCDTYARDPSDALALYRALNEPPFPELETRGGNNFVRMFFDLNGVCGLDSAGRVSCYAARPSLLPYLSQAASHSVPFLDLAQTSGHVCGVQTTGRLVCWAGDPTLSWAVGPNASPHADYIDVEVASGTTCALRRGGQVECWGAKQGALDQFTQLARQDFVQLAVGSERVCGRREDGSIACAGIPSIGEPVATERPGPFVDLWMQERGNICALTNEGALRCWGPYPYDGEALVVARRRSAD